MDKMLITGLAATAACLAGWGSPACALNSPVPTPVIGLLAAGNAPDEADPASIAPAQQAAPDALLNAATLAVIASLKQDRHLQISNPARFAELVESTILPLFDFRRMTQLAVARNWRIASSEQQNSLVGEFRTLLIRTYSSALANYRDQAIEYKPLRMAPGVTAVTVRSEVKQTRSERMTIDYDMEKASGGWKVYDIKIAGISLITNYRENFAQIILGSGVAGLIDALAQKNRQADPGPRSQDSGARPLLFMYSVMPSIVRGDR